MYLAHKLRSGSFFKLVCIQHVKTTPSRDVDGYNCRKMKSVAKMYLKFKLLDMIIVQFLIIIERYHLFVWTVFAPKLVYEVASLSVFLLFYLICS